MWFVNHRQSKFLGFENLMLAEEMKKVLLIAGTGTLGGSAYPELVKLGYHVDVISLEDYRSVTPRLEFIRARAKLAFLKEFFAARGRYDAVVDFIHTPERTALERR